MRNSKKMILDLMISVLICCLAAVSVTACASGDTPENVPETEELIQQEDTNGQADVGTADDAGSDSEASGSQGGSVDVDLTVLSSTMVYSEVSDMMTSPENYMGKSVRMNGAFAVYHDESTDKYYYACIIKDATACCSQGIEFELKGDHKYPDDYPEVGAEITVEGEFDTYKEGENQYCTLRNAVMA